MERDIFGKKAHNSQPARCDRFIAPRSSIADLQQRHFVSEVTSNKKSVVNCWYTKYLQEKRYSTYIKEALGLQHVKTPWLFDQQARQEPGFWDGGQPWPCMPRRRSCLTSADSVLDLPNYESVIFPELLDWSIDDILVAALGTTYYTWCWDTQSVVSRGMTSQKIFCCKYHPVGDLLALGTDKNHLEIHDTEMNKQVVLSYCRCWRKDSEYCFITAIDWSSTGSSFATGCSRGYLISFSIDGTVQRQRFVCREPISLVKVSPDARFVAICQIKGKNVRIFTWPALEHYFDLKTHNVYVRTIAWHPWRSALLGVGGVTYQHQTTILLFDVPPTKLRCAFTSSGPYCIDSMIFSHRTGEMVTSLWNMGTGADDPKGSRIVVFSGPDTVVDEMGEGQSYLDRIRTMVFSPDGSKLATATAGEDLILWNFLPDDEKKKKINSRKRVFSFLPWCLDGTTGGSCLR